ncbi:MAG: hypothetical protein JMN25_14660 [gamma proteobacterium endosymbiont of Lamellibrachia anaximandri]|nr:hypothetical protein [gamma proteobacterium endosymbiont of Lamellibrachia anaximandri]
MANKQFSFDVDKLLSLMERRKQAGVVLIDLSERHREARSDLLKAKQISERYVHRGGVVREPAPQYVAEIRRNQAEVDRIFQELENRREEFHDLMATASRCERWARDQGWREDLSIVASRPSVAAENAPGHSQQYFTR